MVNRFRGEVSLELGNRRYLLRPSFSALAAIEGRAGKGLLALAKDLQQGCLPLSAILIILEEGGMAAENRGMPPEWQALIEEYGAASFINTAARFMAAALGTHHAE